MKTVPKNSPKQGFFIKVGCPGCGGELQIDADFFVTKCSHCGSPLRLELPETPPAYLIPFKIDKREARFKIDRKLKAVHLPLTGQPLEFKKIYYPYWKIDAMLLRCRNRKEKVTVAIDDSSGEEVIDYKKNRNVNLTPYQKTVAGADFFEGVPDSIGIRGQSLNVVPFASSKIEDDALALDIRRAPDEVIKTVELSLSKLNMIELADFGQNITRIFNPTSSLIYFPFCIVEDYAGAGFRRYVLDGLTGRILFSKDSENEHENFLREESSGSSFESFLTTPIFETDSQLYETDIPDSGIRSDTEIENAEPYVHFGEVKVLFHRCRECGEDLPPEPSCIYICSNCLEMTCLDKQLQTIPEISAAETASQLAAFYPFWQFKNNSGKIFGSINELENILIPAFKISNFEALYRLSRRTSTASGNFDFNPIEVLDERFRAVDVLPSAAVALANVVFYRYVLEKTSKIPKEHLAIDLNSARLCYIPFELENYFFVDSTLKSITFEKSLA